MKDVVEECGEPDIVIDAPFPAELDYACEREVTRAVVYRNDGSSTALYLDDGQHVLCRRVYGTVFYE